jgi:Trypsin
MDPAVVILEAPGGLVCSGALIAPDVVLTARHCTSLVVAGATCPPPASQRVQVMGELNPGSMRVLLGDEVASAVVSALGLAFIVPSTETLCGSDIALVLLDRPIASVTPLLVQSVGIAEGQHVRSVSYGNDPGLKILREHVPVVETATTEFRVAEGSCEGGGGGPALDEATGKVVGVLAEFGPSCKGPHPYDVYTRVEVFYPLVEEALAASMEAGKKLSAANRTDPTDYGGACSTGSDCGAGVCVDEGSTEYCSRSCSATDRCPPDYKCVSAGNSGGATSPFCVQSE